MPIYNYDFLLRNQIHESRSRAESVWEGWELSWPNKEAVYFRSWSCVCNRSRGDPDSCFHSPWVGPCEHLSVKEQWARARVNSFTSLRSQSSWLLLLGWCLWSNGYVENRKTQWGNLPFLNKIRLLCRISRSEEKRHNICFPFWGNANWNTCFPTP